MGINIKILIDGLVGCDNYKPCVIHVKTLARMHHVLIRV